MHVHYMYSKCITKDCMDEWTVITKKLKVKI